MFSCPTLLFLIFLRRSSLTLLSPFSLPSFIPHSLPPLIFFLCFSLVLHCLLSSISFSNFTCTSPNFLPSPSLHHRPSSPSLPPLTFTNLNSLASPSLPYSSPLSLPPCFINHRSPTFPPSLPLSFPSIVPPSITPFIPQSYSLFLFSFPFINDTLHNFLLNLIILSSFFYIFLHL